jgi:NAD(P)-dependent dehydrogenase (short-subunit alcohol dehydrogenase family)
MAGKRNQKMNNPLDMSGKVVLITGGSRGLGRAMALGFAEQGADIAIISRKIDSCERTATEIEALGRKAFPYACNVRKWDALEGMVEAVYDRFGHVDVLINNAGMSPVAPSLLEISETLFDKVIGVNLKGPFRLSALIGSRMAALNGGNIINISSIGSINPKAQTAIYGAAKAGLNAITKAFAYEYGPKVRVNCILCGPFHTDISKGWSRSEAFTMHVQKDYALQRAGDPKEIVSTALYLASDFSSYTTGALIRVDGGAP